MLPLYMVLYLFVRCHIYRSVNRSPRTKPVREFIDALANFQSRFVDAGYIRIGWPFGFLRVFECCLVGPFR